MRFSLERRRLLAGGIGLGFGMLAAPSAFAEDGWKPHRGVEVIVGVSPGGSMDRTARLLERALSEEHFIPRSSMVLNKPGGGHAVALAYTAMRRGNAELIQLINSPLLTNKILGRGDLSYTDVTPLANLFMEHMMFAVNTKSPIKDARDLVARLKADPRALSFSVSSGLGTVNEMAVLMLAEAAGVDPKKVKAISFNSASEGTTAVVGGHVDVLVTTPFSIEPFVRSGDLRALAIASEKRIDGSFSGVPTWGELGVDVMASGMRVVIGPPGLQPSQIAFWSHALRKVTEKESWHEMVAADYLTPNFLDPSETVAYLARDNERYTKLYRSVGVI